VDSTPSYCVILGDGHKKGTSECCKVEVRLVDYTFKETFYLFDLGGVDVSLGVAWLATLGEVKVNWQTLTMIISSQGRLVKIQGDHSLTKTLVRPQALKKEKRIATISIFWRIEAVNPTMITERRTNLSKQQTVELEGVLKECEGVFEETKELPPYREVDHRIPIKEEMDAIDVRPYKYLHQLKEEIEKQVEEMLKMGIIRPSKSPCSNPIILVKKKYGSWRFCVGYRAPNKVTIHDKFSIPVIEELSDELHGASFSSKIDLRSSYHQIRMHYESLEMSFK